jgi:diguanylate cyclase (GGDEF)-like protein/PAS domain S-box-containing protein
MGTAVSKEHSSDRALATDWTAVAFDAVPEIVVVIDAGGKVVHANARAEELLRTRLEDWVGRSVIEVLHPDDVPMAAELLVSAQTGAVGPKESVRYRLRASDGETVEVAAIAAKVERDDGTFLVLSARPGDEPRPDAAIVGEVSGRLSRMFDDAAIGMAQVALDGRFLRVNPTLVGDLALDAGTLLRTHVHELIRGDSRPVFDQVWRELVDGGASAATVEAAFDTPVGVRHLHLAGSVVGDRHGDPMYVALQMVNVTQRVIAEQALRESQLELRETQRELLHQTTHDALTGLGNRLLLARTFEQIAARSDDRQVAVISLDLDGFKAVNDQFGHAVGDELLVAVADRIQRSARPEDVVVRFGGDEFLVIQAPSTLAVATDTAQSILAALAVPFALSVGATQTQASAGLVVAEASTAGANLLDAADRLLYDARRHHTGQLRTAARSA